MSSIFDRLTRSLPWNKPIELPEHHHWKYANLPALLEWRIRARPYNTTVANGMFLFLLFAGCLGVLLILNVAAAAGVYGIFITIFLFTLTMAAIYSTTHQKTKFSYRFTEQGVEVCEWKAPSKIWMVALKWLTVIAAIAVIFVIALDPSAALIALAGPGGMGLLYLGLANSKKFQEMHTDYNTFEYNWSEFKSVIIDRPKKIICLESSWLSPHSNQYVDWPFYIFSNRSQFDKHLSLVLDKLKGLPCSEQSVSVLQF